VVVLAWPTMSTIITAFYRELTFAPSSFTGLNNFFHLFSSDSFFSSSIFTLVFVLVSVPLELVFGFTLALVLWQMGAGRGVVAALLLVPWAVPSAVSARIWDLYFQYEYGALNALLGFFGVSPVNWLGSSTGAALAILIADIWKTTPFITVIVLSGLSSIPSEIIEAAKIDGCRPLQRIWCIILPLSKQATIVALLFRTIDALRLFELPFVLTGGGPGGVTTPISLLAYRHYIGGDFGMGAAASLLLFLVAFGLAIWYARIGSSNS